MLYLQREIAALFIRASWTPIHIPHPSYEDAVRTRTKFYRLRRELMEAPHHSPEAALCAPLLSFTITDSTLTVHPRDTLPEQIREALDA